MPTGLPFRKRNATLARMKVNAGAGFFRDGVESLPECDPLQIKIENGVGIAHLIRNDIGSLFVELGEYCLQGCVLALKRRQE